MNSAISERFHHALVALGPFEPQLHFAVAVSGGPDSLSLTLLAHYYATSAGGRITALTVDHRLRPESRQEALQVAAWMSARGIAHHTLSWHHEGIEGNLQEKAREARYALLSEWCRAHGVLHLLAGHTQDDQAETLLIRLKRGSGASGLAGIPTVTLTSGVRVLRPLLGFYKKELQDFLRAQHQPWLEDPGNSSDRFERSRLRARLATLPDAVQVNAQLADAATRLGAWRHTEEQRRAALLAEHARLYPQGYGECDAELLALPDAPQLLERLLTTIGGLTHPPRAQQTENAVQMLRSKARHTLAGCVIARHENGFRITREATRLTARIPMLPGQPTLWDDRWQAKLKTNIGNATFVGALSRSGVALLKARKYRAISSLPASVLPTLPALWSVSEGLEELLCVPHIHYHATAAAAGFSAHFAPRNPLAAAPFCYTITT